MNSDGDEIYTKIVVFDEIYNFVVRTFSFDVIFELKKSIYGPDLVYGIQIWIVDRLFELEDDFKWKKIELISSKVTIFI
jgi:hypothetical protein